MDILVNSKITTRAKIKKCTKNVCSVKTLKRRLPIIQWLPLYNTTKLLQDIIAGITVALTAIPQGIAYAVVVGLSPEYGLYGGLMGGFVYLFFGTSKDVTVGPTAIISTMTSKYVVGYSADFAVLAAFLSGLVILLMGILQLGFLVDFISGPVINGFTTAAALQIAAAQLKGLFGFEGPAGSYFAESLYYLVKNIKTAKLWDPVLGVFTIIILCILKGVGEGSSRTGNCAKQMRWFLSLARNAIVVIIGMVIAYILKVVTDSEPITLIGDIGSGLPSIQLPPFSTVVGNETYTFVDMFSVYGPQSIILPLVAILESVAIAKAFAGGAQLDATQEMIALGLCNIIGSFVRSMPVTGSFTRTALNNASGVQTPAGGIFTGFIIIMALGLLTSTFYFIPKPSLAGLIITAMYSMVHTDIFRRLYRNSKRELFVLILTMAVCLFIGLEFGIMAGTVAEAAILLFNTSRPVVNSTTVTISAHEVTVVPLTDSLAYCAAENVRRAVLKSAQKNNLNNYIVIDGTDLKSMDTTVAINLMTSVKDLEKQSFKIMFLNFSLDLKNMCTDITPNSEHKFLLGSSIEDCFVGADIVISKV